MRVHHFYPHTKNVGDYFVRDGIRARTREVHPNAEFIDVPANPRTPGDTSSGLKGANMKDSLGQLSPQLGRDSRVA